LRWCARRSSRTSLGGDLLDREFSKPIEEIIKVNGVTRELFVQFRDSLEKASVMGSLVRLEKHFLESLSRQGSCAWITLAARRMDSPSPFLQNGLSD
jgi:hypothetical protein